MKFSAQEEYGLRCLLRIAKFYHVGKSLTIPEISRSEGISEHNTGKILRVLRLGGFLTAGRGQFGGYTLSKAPEEIKVDQVLYVLGGKLYDDSFCRNHSGAGDLCTNSIDCSVRSLWKIIQDSVNSVVKDLTLKDLLGSESELFELVSGDSVKHN
ncbi:MAG TPA: Rrf2 family transcriptional regulator [Melioribacteraceae bacterium]|nr:Rrf2 family transcriptional regulator [Melioribacteraceae bacterium]